MKIGVAQIEIIPGRPDLNLEKVLEYIEKAKKESVELVVFPEMTIPGYLLGDEWENESFVVDCEEKNKKITESSKKLTVIWGNVEIDREKKNEDGRARKYNTAFVASDGKMIDKRRKTLMPKYREFDDERHFFSNSKLAFENNKSTTDYLETTKITASGEVKNIGIILCEDMWSDDYAINPAKVLTDKGAEILINISCSPWTKGKNDKRHRVVKNLSSQTHIPLIYSNNVGVQNNGKNIFLFDGLSTIYDKNGEIVDQAKAYEEKLLVWEGDESEKVANQKADNEIKTLHDGIVYGIKKFTEVIGNKKVVLGLSGGIDSAVSTCLLVEAVGKENVLAINMPSRFNSDLTKSAAKKLANNLGINYKIIPIQDSVDLTKKQLEDAGFEVSSMTLENIQARDRGSRVLAGVAAAIGGIFINNGNKTETAFGYATLYGDVNGAFAPIADLYKNEIYQLAEYINNKDNKEIIPSEIIKVVPSAELSESQDVTKGKGDPINYPYHDKLVRAFVEWRWDPERILMSYLNKTLEKEFCLETGVIDKYFPSKKEFIDDLEAKWLLFKRNVFKRIQAPPIIAVSKRAFGFDLRESQTKAYYTDKYLEYKKDHLNK